MIDEFFGEYRWLSNFENCKIPYDGYIYHSVQCAYQAQKFKGTKLQEQRMKSIFTKIESNEAKILGNMVNLREDWEEVRDGIMEQLLRIKFEDPYYKQMLLDTGNEELVEGTKWHDLHFGRCNCPIHNGEGDNVLGNLLMKLREEYRNEQNN